MSDWTRLQKELRHKPGSENPGLQAEEQSLKPFRPFADAVPLDGRGRRTPHTLLLIDERDAPLREAARRFCVGMSHREAARQLRTALLRYQTGAWRRTRVEATCPVPHAGKLPALLWMILKVRDHVPFERLIRAVLARSPA